MESLTESGAVMLEDTSLFILTSLLGYVTENIFVAVMLIGFLTTRLAVGGALFVAHFTSSFQI